MTLNKKAAVAFAGIALIFLALSFSSADADDCDTGQCTAPGSKKHEPEQATPAMIDVQHRCYGSKSEEIRFPMSPILPNLFHGWVRQDGCSNAGCDSSRTDLPPATCGPAYHHKTLIVKIRDEQVPINTCPSCQGSNHGEGSATQIIPSAEKVPAPRPASLIPK